MSTRQNSEPVIDPENAHSKHAILLVVGRLAKPSVIAVLGAILIFITGCATQECGTCYVRPGEDRRAGACVKCDGIGKISTATAYSTYTCGYCNGTRYMTCPICRGAGFYDDNGNPCALGAGAHPCAACSQTGKVACVWCTNGLRQGGPSAYSSSPCSNCGGTGKCPACSGGGKQTNYAPLIEFGVVLFLLAIPVCSAWSAHGSKDSNVAVGIAAGLGVDGLILWLFSFLTWSDDNAYNRHSGEAGTLFVVGLIAFVVCGFLMQHFGPKPK